MIFLGLEVCLGWKCQYRPLHNPENNEILLPVQQCTENGNCLL